MMKRLLVIPFFLTVLSFANPFMGHAESVVEIIDNDFQNISISVNASTIHVTGANGQTLYLYNVAGVRVMSIIIESSDFYCELNVPKGCYIAKVGKVVKKIPVK